MKLLVLLSFDLPDDHAGNLVPDIIQRINPAALPFFDRAIRLVIDPLATQVEEYLDADED